MKKKLLVALMCVCCLGVFAVSLAACTQNGTKYKVGILQFGSHGSLDNCYNGFVAGLVAEGLDDSKVDVDFVNAEFDINVCNTAAQKFKNTGKDLICGIATPAAQSCITAAAGKIPVIFNAVSDPYSEELKFDQKENVTGSSDQLPLRKQLDMIGDFFPNRDEIKVGILITASESNSQSHLKQILAITKNEPNYTKFKIVYKQITNSSEILQNVSALVNTEKVDCITNFTDNEVVASLSTILAEANKKNIPVFGSEIEQVKLGCMASISLDYIDLGFRTGRMAARILKGEKKASDLSVYTETEGTFIYNQSVSDRLGFTVPEDLKNSKGAENVSSSSETT